jgi:Kef-type K+ transport system membrane component KefB
MASLVSLQTATGGSTEVVVLILLGLAVSSVLSLAVAYKTVRDYRRNRERGRLYFAIGLVLLTTVPILLRVVLTNLDGVSSVERSLVTTLSELLGLLTMLYAIYVLHDREASRATVANTAGPSR